MLRAWTWGLLVNWGKESRTDTQVSGENEVAGELLSERKHLQGKLGGPALGPTAGLGQLRQAWGWGRKC